MPAPRVVAGDVHQALRRDRRLVGLDHSRRHPARPSAGGNARAPARPHRPRLTRGRRPALAPGAARLEQPMRPLARDRARLAFTLGVQRAAALTQLRAATLRARHDPGPDRAPPRPPRHRYRRLAWSPGCARGRVVPWPRAAPCAAPRGCVGGRAACPRADCRRACPGDVDLRGLFEGLAGDLAEVAVGVDRRVGRHLGAGDCHHPDRRQPRPGRPDRARRRRPRPRPA